MDDLRGSTGTFAQESLPVSDRFSMLGFDRLQAGDARGAEIAFGRALMGDPYHPNALLGRILVCLRLDDVPQAHKLCHKLLALGAENSEARVLHADVLLREMKFARAREEAKQALILDPALPQAHSLLAEMDLAEGDVDDARQRLQNLLEQRPDFPCYMRYAQLADFREEKNACDLVTKRLRAITDDFAPAARADAYFAAGRMYDRLGRHREAFDHWEKANALVLAGSEVTALAHIERLGQARRGQHAPLNDICAPCGNGSDIQPVFIVSLPRSGSTLLEQVLSSHPRVVGLGEHADGINSFETVLNGLLRSGGTGSDVPAPDSPPPGMDTASQAIRQARDACLLVWKELAQGKNVIVLKNLSNGIYLGIIRAAFPEARFVHIRRHPMDTFLSCYANWFEVGFHYSYDVKLLADYMNAWEGLMQHWRSLYGEDAQHCLIYEDLVDNPQVEIPRLLEFCGLENSQRCLRFWETKRAVRTISAPDVRKPLYKSSMGRWKAYEDRLGQTQERLREVITAFDARRGSS